jgi:hypothetical protein
MAGEVATEGQTTCLIDSDVLYCLSVVFCANLNTYCVRSVSFLVQPRAERMVTCSVVMIDSL